MLYYALFSSMTLVNSIIFITPFENKSDLTPLKLLSSIKVALYRTPGDLQH